MTKPEDLDDKLVYDITSEVCKHLGDTWRNKATGLFGYLTRQQKDAFAVVQNIVVLTLCSIDYEGNYIPTKPK